MKNGGLNANEFIDRIIELLASRIVIEKNEKEFMTFLAQYVKQVEKKLHHHDFRTYNRGSMNSLDDEEDKPIQGNHYIIYFIEWNRSCYFPITFG